LGLFLLLSKKIEKSQKFSKKAKNLGKKLPKHNILFSHIIWSTFSFWPMWHLWTVTNSNPICGRSAIPFPYYMVNYCLENYKKIVELASQKKDKPPNPKYKKDTPLST